jgi:hypothetical protein
MKIGDAPVKIDRDLAGVVSLQTIKLWIKIVNNTGSIDLSSLLVIHAPLVQKPISRKQNGA